MVCLQETRAHPGDVQHVKWPAGFEVHWNSAEKKGYSGTAVLTRVKPLSARNGIGVAVHDTEGRVLALEFPDFWLVNVYQPNSQRGLTRLDYRVRRWDPAFRAYLRRLQSKGKPAVFCGDLNVAHEEIDLANPRSNRRNAGFTDEERASFGRLLDGGFVDTFREFEKGPGHYTWWSQTGRLQGPQHRVARRLLCSRGAAAAGAQARVDQPGGDGKRPLPGRARARLTGVQFSFAVHGPFRIIRAVRMPARTSGAPAWR